MCICMSSSCRECRENCREEEEARIDIDLGDLLILYSSSIIWGALEDLVAFRSINFVNFAFNCFVKVRVECCNFVFCFDFSSVPLFVPYLEL